MNPVACINEKTGKITAYACGECGNVDCGTTRFDPADKRWKHCIDATLRAAKRCCLCFQCGAFMAHGERLYCGPCNSANAERLASIQPAHLSGTECSECEEDGGQHLPDCKTGELAEWRSGKRRIFFRVKSDAKGLRVQFDFAHKFDANHDALECINPKVYRVTVRTKGAKR